MEIDLHGAKAQLTHHLVKERLIFVSTFCVKPEMFGLCVIFARVSAVKRRKFEMILSALLPLALDYYVIQSPSVSPSNSVYPSSPPLYRWLLCSGIQASEINLLLLLGLLHACGLSVRDILPITVKYSRCNPRVLNHFGVLLLFLTVSETPRTPPNGQHSPACAARCTRAKVGGSYEDNRWNFTDHFPTNFPKMSAISQLREAMLEVAGRAACRPYLLYPAMREGEMILKGKSKRSPYILRGKLDTGLPALAPRGNPGQREESLRPQPLQKGNALNISARPALHYILSSGSIWGQMGIYFSLLYAEQTITTGQHTGFAGFAKASASILRTARSVGQSECGKPQSAPKSPPEPFERLAYLGEINKCIEDGKDSRGREGGEEWVSGGGRRVDGKKTIREGRGTRKRGETEEKSERTRRRDSRARGGGEQERTLYSDRTDVEGERGGGRKEYTTEYKRRRNGRIEGEERRQKAKGVYSYKGYTTPELRITAPECEEDGERARRARRALRIWFAGRSQGSDDAQKKNLVKVLRMELGWPRDSRE
ncbi:hypothetical protein DFH06DRAFT_1132658 [Mycena polygramma]|nr:hypothetical protein DFH06DRAFT_1132658 [Mycena polygramma]